MRRNPSDELVIGYFGYNSEGMAYTKAGQFDAIGRSSRSPSDALERAMIDMDCPDWHDDHRSLHEMVRRVEGVGDYRELKDKYGTVMSPREFVVGVKLEKGET